MLFAHYDCVSVLHLHFITLLYKIKLFIITKIRIFIYVWLSVSNNFMDRKKDKIMQIKSPMSYNRI